MDPKPFIEKVLEKFGVLMVNEEKVGRAVFGMTTSKGFVNGVKEDATEEVILAKYDELHGYMTKGGYKVKHGTFVDLKTKKPIEKPKIILLIKINGEYVEQEEGAEESLEMKVTKKQIEKKKKK